MMVLPVKCPRCGHVTSWSPLRVWCGYCSFAMVGQEYEGAEAIVRRWNRAVEEGIGYVELVRENNAREAAKMPLEMSSLKRGVFSHEVKY